MIEGKQRQLYIGKVTELVTKYVENKTKYFGEIEKRKNRYEYILQQVWKNIIPER